MSVPGGMHESDKSFAVSSCVGVRLGAVPATAARETWIDLDPHDASQADAAADFLRTLAARPGFRESVETASASLGRVLADAAAGRTVSGARLRRAIIGSTKYLIRSATRPTPYGLLSGVGFAEFIDEGATSPRAVVSPVRRRGVRPDMAWLDGVVRKLESDDAVLAGLRVVPNNTCFVRGVRLVNPSPPFSADTNHPRRETSVLLSSAVTTALRIAKTAPRVADLVRCLCETFTSTSERQATRMISRLVAEGYLVTDLRPSLSNADPLGHVLDLLPPAHRAGLAAVQENLARYAATPIGSGIDAWRRSREASLGLHDAANHAQVDLRIDMDVAIPRAVADEIADYAEVLQVATGSDEPETLREFRNAFVERYGHGALVPVKQLVDAEFGLGAPSGYKHPPSRRTTPWSEKTEARIRLRSALLGRWLQEAMLDGSHEIALSDKRLTELAELTPHEPRTPFELAVRLRAETIEDLVRGNYQILPSPMAGSRLQQSAAGRFMYLTPERQEDVRSLASGSPDGPLPVQLDYLPLPARLANVCSHPRILPQTLPVGRFYEPDGDQSLDLDDIAIGATDQALFVLWLSRGTQIDPITLTKLNPDLNDNVTRLLREIGAYRRSAAVAWDWGNLRGSAYLPRVTWGRHVLSLASWRLPVELLGGDLPDAEWEAGLAAWRSAWHVPDVVQVGQADNLLELNLTSALHRRILRAETSKPDVREIVVQEAPGTAESCAAWLDGYASELIVQLTPRARAAERRVTIPDGSHRVPAERHYIGGEWLFLKLYATEQRQRELLAGPIRELTDSLPEWVDRWFFIRYRDPDSHIRLRIHGDAARLSGELLPMASRLLRDLCDSGYLNRFTLDEYLPETNRYGTGATLRAAEQAFCADSRIALRLLARLDPAMTQSEMMVQAALNSADLASGVLGEDWSEWLCHTYPAATFTPILRDARTRLRKAWQGDWDRTLLRWLDGDDELESLRKQRRNALVDYALMLDGASDPGLPSVSRAARSILHMGFNRLFGVSREKENDGYSLARIAVADAAARRRSGS